MENIRKNVSRGGKMIKKVMLCILLFCAALTAQEAFHIIGNKALSHVIMGNYPEAIKAQQLQIDYLYTKINALEYEVQRRAECRCTNSNAPIAVPELNE